MLRAVRRALDVIGAAKERLGVGAFDRPAAVMLLELVRLHAGGRGFGLEIGDDAAGFDVRHATSAAFKRVKIGQIVESRRYSSEPHDLSAAWAMRRLWALVAHDIGPLGRKGPRHPRWAVAPMNTCEFKPTNCLAAPLASM